MGQDSKSGGDIMMVSKRNQVMHFKFEIDEHLRDGITCTLGGIDSNTVVRDDS
jgi:hypothetical protein